MGIGKTQKKLSRMAFLPAFYQQSGLHIRPETNYNNLRMNGYKRERQSKALLCSGMESYMRIGMGYDVHRLVENRKLIIGGVEIPYEKGLLGHSDADVLLHAVMDALLGAAALGDIGKHFPDTDPAYSGISSLKLLERVGELLEEHSFLIENIDATIIAQEPKMRPHIDTMRENIARALGIDVSQINVKATTEEGLGFTGNKEGISSQAVCLLNTPYGLYSEEVGKPACSGCGGCPKQ